MNIRYCSNKQVGNLVFQEKVVEKPRSLCYDEGGQRNNFIRTKPQRTICVLCVYRRFTSVFLIRNNSQSSEKRRFFMLKKQYRVAVAGGKDCREMPKAPLCRILYGRDGE